MKPKTMRVLRLLSEQGAAPSLALVLGLWPAAALGVPGEDGAFKAYVSIPDADQVAVVDLQFREVVRFLNVGPDPRGVDASPDGGLVYVANRFGQSVQVIDTELDEVLETIDLSGVTTTEPYDVAVAPDGSFLAVAMKNGGGEAGDGAVVLVDLATGGIREVPLGSAASPEGVVVSPDGRYVFVAGRGGMYAVDAVRGASLGAVGRASRELVATPDGGWVLAADNAVSVPDMTAHTLPLQFPGRGMAITPEGARVFATDEGRLWAYEIDVQADPIDVRDLGEVTDPVGPPQRGAYGVDIAPDGSVGMVSWRWSESVQVFDPNTLEMLGAPISTRTATDGGEPKQLVIVAGAVPPPGECLLEATSLGAPAFDPQTGLFVQRVEVTVSASHGGGVYPEGPTVRTLDRQPATGPVGCLVEALELRVEGLEPGTVLYNGRVGPDGLPMIHYEGLLTEGDRVTFVLEYYRADRRPPGEPVFVVEAVAPETTPPVEGTRFEVLRSMWLEDGRFLVEFESEPGRQYAVEYSDDLNRWLPAGPPLIAGGTKTQWIDYGPPLTPTAPEKGLQRYYRVVKLP